MSQEHWDDLYQRLNDAYQKCVENDDETYSIKIGIILDHMIYNQPYLTLN